MAASFKIPKKKHSGGSSSAPLPDPVPLSCLPGPTQQTKSYVDRSGRGGTDGAGITLDKPADRQSPVSEPSCRAYVKTLLLPQAPNGEAATANRTAPGSCSGRSQPGNKRGLSSDAPLNRWRPKRTSDRFLQPKDASEPPSSEPPSSEPPSSEPPSSEPPSSPQRMKSSLLPFKSISVEVQDSLAELQAQRHAGSLSSLRLVNIKMCPVSVKRKSDRDFPEKKSLEDDLMSPSRSKTHISQVSAGSNRPGDHNECDRRWLSVRRDLQNNKGYVLTPRQKRPKKQKPTEPIVLSSEEEEEARDRGRLGYWVPPIGCRGAESQQRNSAVKEVGDKAPRASSLRCQTDESPPPSFLQLKFSSLHAGLTDAQANGDLRITEHDITLPVKGLEEVEEVEVTVVASQVRGYGVWDGSVVRGGPLLAGWKGPAPSLLFLWVTDAQANLLQRELSFIQSSNTAGPACSFLLLVLTEKLQDLQAALLASILDMKEYRRSSSSSSGGPSSPLEWTDGLLLLQSCPSPLNQHLLGLLGHAVDKSSPTRNSRSSLGLSGQQVSSRLIQYPAAPCKGRISVSKEDVTCLDSGQFLNDVIIDFYLKYLFMEGVGGPVAERSHIFSSFFYKQLSRRRVAGEDSSPCIPDRHTRHQRVKRWTRHVDVFTKDFLFIPVNQEAHWFLVVVCFPGLEDVQYEEFQRPTGGLREPKEPTEPRSLSLRSQQPPNCTEQGLQRGSVLKRPCILVMDSLKLTYQKNVCQLLRDYLQVEWEVRRGTPRVFTSDSMKCSNCRVPQQDNSSDCGLYLLQYAESFLQNPVVHFDLPLRLDNWFPRQAVRQKREEIRSLILKLHQNQRNRK